MAIQRGKKITKAKARRELLEWLDGIGCVESINLTTALQNGRRIETLCVVGTGSGGVAVVNVHAEPDRE
jgi:hypothetical protein